ncbi:MAG: hypothetical protein LBE13_08185 [Bacteroidales bacterium]|jgi:hypothetical protein|nr:hypothetical protein [Bacteroidales bacterium]
MSKIEESQEILRALGLPAAQQNESRIIIQTNDLEKFFNHIYDILEKSVPLQKIFAYKKIMIWFL